MLGAALSDRADEIADGGEIATGPALHPLMAVPFAATVARIAGIQVEVAWPGAVMYFAPKGMRIDGSNRTPSDVATLTCRRVEMTAIADHVPVAGRSVHTECWGRLTALAHRTYAPATEASRLAGAGAGLTDND